MKWTITGIIILSIIFSPLESKSQISLDSLNVVWNDSDQPDSTKFSTIHYFIWDNYMFSQPDSAEFYAMQMEEYARKKGIQKQLLNALNARGVSHAIRDNTEEAAEYFLKCTDIAKAIGDEEQAAGMLLNLGGLYHAKGDFDNALNYYSESLEYAQSEELKSLTAKNLTSMAIVYMEQGNYALSIETLFKALKYREEEGDQIGIAKVYLELGIVHQNNENLTEAKDYFNKAIDIFEDNNNQFDLENTLINLARLNFQEGEYEKALELFSKSYEIAMNMDDISSQAESLGEIGHMHSKMSEPSKAIDFLEQSKQLAESLGDKTQIIRSSNYLAEVFEHLGKNQEAIDLLEKSNALSQELDFKSGLVFSAEALSRLHKKEKNYETSLKYFELYSETQKLINSEKNLKAILKSKINYEYEGKALADSLNFVAKEQVHQAELSTRTRTQYFSVIGLLLLFLIVYLLRTQQFAKRKQTLQAEFSRNLIRGQEDERTRVARDLHDSVGQKLMLLTKKTKDFGDDNTSVLAQNTLEELRSISRSLHPASLEQLGITSAIQALINEVDANTETFFTHDIENIDELFQTEQELHLYRIIQEVLNNMVKHAAAKAASITLEQKPTFVLVQIKDNGQGFNVSEKITQAKSLGMKTLMERSKIINSDIEIDSQLGKGTTINLKIPLSV